MTLALLPDGSMSGLDEVEQTLRDYGVARETYD